MSKKIKQPSTVYIGCDDGLIKQFLQECHEDANMASVGLVPDSYLTRQFVVRTCTNVMKLLKEINRLKRKCNEEEINFIDE